MFCAVLLIVTRLMGISMQTVKKPNLTEFPWQNNVFNAKFSVEARLKHGFCYSIHVRPTIITVSTLLSLLQLMKRFKLYVLIKRKLKCCVHFNRPNGPKHTNTLITRVDRVFMTTQCLHTCRPWFYHRIHASPMIIIVCTLLSPLQFIKRFKLYVLIKRIIALFS